MTWQLDAVQGHEERLLRYLREALPIVFGRPGVVGAHVGVSDRVGSEIMTEERKTRGSITQVPGWVVLLEGVSGAVLESAAQDGLDRAVLEAHGARQPVEQGTYRLECSLARAGRAD